MRLPLVEVDEAELAAACAGCSSALRLGVPAARLSWLRHAARPAARRAGRDRQEHDRRRVRRPHRRGRHRPDVPDHRDARDRPGAARLHLPARPRRGRSRRSCSRTATRTTSAPCRGCCASSDRMRPPIYGGPLTVAMARSKIEEHKLKNVPSSTTSSPARTIEAGPVRPGADPRLALDPGRVRRRRSRASSAP